MLTPVITFEIRDFINNSFEKFVVPDVKGIYELVAGHRFTRSIQFDEKFSFEKMSIPTFILENLITEYISEFRPEFELDDVDEMVGMYV